MKIRIELDESLTEEEVVIYCRQLGHTVLEIQRMVSDIKMCIRDRYDLVEEGSYKTIRITLKYGADKNEKIISGLKRISKPGLRVYVNKEELPRVLGGLGIAILSTNQGVITDKQARKLQVGGEVLAFVW